MVLSGAVCCLPSLRMSSPQQAGMLPRNTAGGCVSRASLRGYYHLSDHQPGGMAAARPAPPSNEPVSLCILHQWQPLALFICSEQTPSRLKPQHKSHLEPSVGGGSEVTLSRSHLGVLAWSPASLIDENKLESCSFPIQCLPFPRRHLDALLKPLLSRSPHPLCRHQPPTFISGKATWRCHCSHLACCGKRHCLRAGWEGPNWGVVALDTVQSVKPCHEV